MYSLYCLLQVYMHSVLQYCGTIEPVAAVLVPEAMLESGQPTPLVGCSSTSKINIIISFTSCLTTNHPAVGS